MPTAAEIRNALHAAWLLARLDPKAMDGFDLSVEGFWRSFFAAVVAAPAYVILVIRQYDYVDAGPNIGTVVSVEALASVLSWLAFPIFATIATKLLRLGHPYVPLVVAANWATVLQVALVAIAVVAGSFLPDAQRPALALAATLVAVIYQWLVVRAALQSSGA